MAWCLPMTCARILDSLSSATEANVCLPTSLDHSHTRLFFLDTECYSTDAAFLVETTASSPCCCQGRLPRPCSQQSGRSSSKVSAAALCALEEHNSVYMLWQQVRGALLAVRTYQIRRLLAVQSLAHPVKFLAPHSCDTLPFSA